MSPVLLVDGNNLGHVLGYIDKTAGRYDTADLLSCLDGVSRYLATQGQDVEIVLFLDDVSAAERLAGWHVLVPPVPDGNADAAIRAYAQARTDRSQTLVSGDQALCDDVALWGVVCLSPTAFVSGYLIPAHNAGFVDLPGTGGLESGSPVSYIEVGEGDPTPTPTEKAPAWPMQDQGDADRQRQTAALERAGAALRGEPLPPREVYRLDLSHWLDSADLALYLAEHHLCARHPNLTDPADMIAAVREHCCLDPRYFTSGRVIHRVFRLLLCRPEHSLSLDDLTRLAKTRRRKIRAAIEKYGEQLGIVVQW